MISRRDSKKKIPVTLEPKERGGSQLKSKGEFYRRVSCASHDSQDTRYRKEGNRVARWCRVRVGAGMEKQERYISFVGLCQRLRDRLKYPRANNRKSRDYRRIN
jgi:hypothetical protein